MRDSFIERAIGLAVENVRLGKGGPFGAVIVRDGRIVAEGVNHVTSAKDPTAHAEIVAIREACRVLGHFHLAGCEIYTSCEPCPMCLGAIYWSCLDRLFFAATHVDAAAAGFSDAFIYGQMKTPLADRTIPTVRLTCEDALAPFDEWKRAEGRVEY